MTYLELVNVKPELTVTFRGVGTSLPSREQPTLTAWSPNLWIMGLNWIITVDQITARVLKKQKVVLNNQNQF